MGQVVHPRVSFGLALTEFVVGGADSHHGGDGHEEVQVFLGLFGLGCFVLEEGQRLLLVPVTMSNLTSTDR